MATYTGRNRKRLQRDLRKARAAGKFATTDQHMEAYGNKRKQFVEDNIRNRKAA